MNFLDHVLTPKLRNAGKRNLSFWKWIASYALFFFAAFWISFVILDVLVWWRPLVPFALSYIALLIIQALVRRERPPFAKLTGYKMRFTTYSFPSGHATMSSSLAGALALYSTFPDAYWGSIAVMSLCLLALIIMYARIAVGVHYVTDIFAGCVLGIAFVLALW